MDIKLQSRLGF